MRRIAVLGASGSGKTWLTNQLVLAFADSASPIQIDDDPALNVFPLPHDAVLLLGLDLSPAQPAQLQAEQLLRKTLTDSSTPFQVIYGQGQSRLLNALQALKAAKPSVDHTAQQGAADSTDRPAGRKPWVWTCEKCSDPVCEHRLLSDLLAKR